MLTVQLFEEKEFEFDVEYGSEIAKALNPKTMKDTTLYKLQDQAYWDAVIAWDHKKQRALAVHSQVISLREATKYMKIAFKNMLPY